MLGRVGAEVLDDEVGEVGGAALLRRRVLAELLERPRGARRRAVERRVRDGDAVAVGCSERGLDLRRAGEDPDADAAGRRVAEQHLRELPRALHLRRERRARLAEELRPVARACEERVEGAALGVPARAAPCVLAAAVLAEAPRAGGYGMLCPFF